MYPSPYESDGDWINRHEVLNDPPGSGIYVVVPKYPRRSSQPPEQNPVQEQPPKPPSGPSERQPSEATAPRRRSLLSRLFYRR